MVDFVVEQNGGPGWLKLWEAHKLRKRQSLGEHYYDPTLSDDLRKLLDNEVLTDGGEFVIEDSPVKDSVEPV